MKKKIVLYNTEGQGTDIEKAYLERHGLSDKYEIVRIDGACDEKFFEEAKDAEGVSIVYLDVTDEVFEQAGVQKVDTLEELFRISDVVSVHTPLLPATYHMSGKEELSYAKPGQLIVCSGRGGVVDEEALKEALESGRIRAAGIDVIEDESQASSVLKGMDQVIMTPHAAYYSEGSIVEDREKSLMQIIEVLEERKSPTYLCNKDVIGNARFEKEQ